MENTTLLASAGHYLPSFFKMEVLSDESFLDFNNLSRKAASIYFHEYIHYIQDIATCHGLLNINRMGEYIRFANLVIKKGGSTFNIPIMPDGDEFNLQANLDFMRVLNGDAAPVHHPKINGVNLVDSSLKKPNGQQIPQVVINYNETAFYIFGGTAIMESMAYIGESHLFPENEPPATFPYQSAELVTKFIYPDFAVNILNVFALCDVALMTGTPGSWFLEALKTMKGANFLPEHPKKVYEFFSNNAFDYGGKEYNTIQSISILSQIAANYLKGYYTSDFFIDNINWFDHILNHALGMRHNNIAFPLDILLHGSFYDNPELKLTMKNIGSPLQINLNDVGAYVEIPDLQLNAFRPEMNWAMAQVERVFAGKIDGCQMKTFCKESCYQQGEHDFTDHRCNTNPWSRVLDNSRCPFVAVLELWQLTQFMPVIKQN